MNPESLKSLLESVRHGEITTEAALERLSRLPFEALDYASIDHHRALRCGFPEVIYGEGKTASQVAEIFERLAHGGADVLATRANPDQFNAVQAVCPKAVFHDSARCISLRQSDIPVSKGIIALVSAGTTDIPVLEEARITCEVSGQRTDVINDVGVAGVHRLIAKMDRLRAARVVVVAAGMDGALPGVVKGLIAAPVIAVPTSVGYGAAFHGVAPLLTMLNACAPGVAVVNIDNGFAAGYLATMINRIGESSQS